MSASCPLIRELKDTVKARAERDPKFRVALLKEAVEQMLAGDIDAFAGRALELVLEVLAG